MKIPTVSPSGILSTKLNISLAKGLQSESVLWKGSRVVTRAVLSVPTLTLAAIETVVSAALTMITFPFKALNATQFINNRALEQTKLAAKAFAQTVKGFVGNHEEAIKAAAAADAAAVAVADAADAADAAAKVEKKAENPSSCYRTFAATALSLALSAAMAAHNMGAVSASMGLGEVNQNETHCFA